MPASSASSDWRAQFAADLPLLGHRNWVLVADAAFPAPVGAVEVTHTGEDHLAVAGEVLAHLRAAPHVRPIVHLDDELKHLPDTLPGLKAVRGGLQDLLAGVQSDFVLHEDLLDRLSETSRWYRVIVLKTTCLVPYTSLFIELDCGYWLPDQEWELRRAMTGPRD
jgi:D-ribose pyranose/furanose isomerase RbsD